MKVAICIPPLTIQKAQTFLKLQERFTTYLIEVAGVELRSSCGSPMPERGKQPRLSFYVVGVGFLGKDSHR